MITLIDASHVFWRNYFGTGSDVAAYEQTLDSFQWYWENCPRTALCCEGRNCFRFELFPEYKSNRKPKPQDAIDSLVAIQQQAASWGCPIVACDGLEADDIIATLVKQAFLEDVQILSNDKDLAQLVSPTVKLCGVRHMGPADVLAKYGVKPEQMRDWLAMVGDAADAIPGCPNCGPGRARDLLQKFGTLEAIRQVPDAELAKVRGIGPKTLESLRAWDPTLALSLVTLRDDAPVDLATLWTNGEKE